METQQRAEGGNENLSFGYDFFFFNTKFNSHICRKRIIGWDVTVIPLIDLASIMQFVTLNCLQNFEICFIV